MNPRTIELVEQYLRGELSREQLSQTLPDVDGSTLDGYIKWVEDSALAIEAHGIRKQLRNYSTGGPRQKPGFRILFWIVGLLIVSVLVVWGIQQMAKKDEPKKLYAFEEPGLIVMMGDPDRYELDDAMTYFKEGRFEMSSEKFGKLYEQDSENDTLIYYLGASLYYENKVEDALPLLSEMTRYTESVFYPRSQYLLALAYHESGQQEQAVRLMKEIAGQPDHILRERASAYLDKWDE